MLTLNYVLSPISLIFWNNSSFYFSISLNRSTNATIELAYPATWN